MAQKRMFSLQVTDTDRFLDMSASAQALYFHLGMHGDDDGFVSSPRKIARIAGCNDDDLRLLAAKGYIIPFESGVVVITDWNINNTLKNDRYHPTIYAEEKSMLTTDHAGRLMLGNSQETTWNHDGTILEPERNLTELNLTKLNKGDKAAILSIRQEQEQISRRIHAAASAMTAVTMGITEWDDGVVYQMLEKVTVLAGNRIKATFRNGVEIEQTVDQPKRRKFT